MKYCKNCKYGSDKRAGYDVCPENLKYCSCPKFRTGYYIRWSEIKIDEVLVEDDEGWAFMVGTEFGCIHWLKGD